MPLRQAIERSQGWHRRLTVPQFTVVTGLLVILLGTLLLATPLCSSSKVGPVSYTHLTLPTRTRV